MTEALEAGSLARARTGAGAAAGSTRPAAAPAHPALVAIGDLYIDTVVDLAEAQPAVRFADVTSSSNCFAPWSHQVGGSALQTARAARAAGFASSTCIGALGARAGGPDPHAQLVIDTAASWGVTLAATLVPGVETGEVLVAYDATGARLMVSKKGANALLAPGLVEPAMRAAVADADVVHISGYTLLDDSRWEAVRSLLAPVDDGHRRGRRGRTLVAVDLAPHNIDRLMDPDVLVARLVDVTDCLMLDMPLLRRLAVAAADEVGDGVGAEVTDDEALAWGLATFPRLVAQPTPAMAVVGVDGRVVARREFAYEPGVASRGQSAVVQTQLLAAMVAS